MFYYFKNFQCKGSDSALNIMLFRIKILTVKENYLYFKEVSSCLVADAFFF
jgi:hypothetical protein